ncbi:MAG: 1,4-alpha-glucan branching enzyme, partial [Selenomonadales bacterium]|nr:1,4-alpha-glucan branching enzyme [Selenomonadales bacterium]
MKVSRLDDTDLYLFHQGNSTKAYKFLGAHCTEEDGQQGVRFSLWAPHAKEVSVVGEFNNWDTRVNAMQKVQDGEIWTLFIPGVKEGQSYKYAIIPPHGGPHMMKADPYGYSSEVRPQTASKVYDMNHYTWND